MQCEGCLSNLSRGKYFQCTKQHCGRKFCYLCANIQDATIVKTWKCPACATQEKKVGDNSSTPIRSDSQNITTRKKTNTKSNSPTGVKDIEVNELTSEIRSLTHELSSLKRKLEEATESLTRCYQRLDELGNAIQTANNRITQLENSETKVVSLQATVTHLENELNNQIQSQLSNEIEIVGIPENNNENLVHIAMVASRKIGIDLTEQDIDWVTRVGPRFSKATKTDTSNGESKFPRPVVLRLLRRSKRNSLIKESKNRRNLTSHDIDVTDHNMVLAGINLEIPKQKSMNKEKVQINAEAIKQDLAEIDWSIVTNIEDVNEAVTNFENCFFPDSWKTALLYPIHKGGCKYSPDNYRPIALLGTFSKLLEKLVNRRLVKYLENQNLLSPKQFGFRSGKSTEDAVSLLITTITSKLDQGLQCVGVFLDLAKAFDTVSNKLLLKKLEKSGVRGLALNWFSSYLNHRRYCLRLGQFTSNTHTTNFGVPQGSILGPTLFILYLNDIHNIKLENSEMICYADDTVLLFWDKSWESVYSKAERGMAQITKWLDWNLLTINIKKTNYICFHKTRMSAPPLGLQIKIHNQCLNNVACDCQCINKVYDTKYLGVYIDQNINFKKHISMTSNKIRNITHVMRKLRESANINTLILFTMPSVTLCCRTASSAGEVQPSQA
ncbi:uncharacterized protein LOC131855443 [Achroia grisella]|uniref:uncharacterized protein LOC131855443 n=1 Tax=Achroia grisella TaxID=688607 RepID=UPI0027D1FF3E|nr:uncharacterized protein LOC131855443 [Achroia grisella]